MKIFARIMSAICIVAAVAVFFFLPVANIDGIKGKDFREMRITLTGDLKKIQAELEDSWLNVHEDLDDNDLPDSKSAIKSRFKETETLLKNTLDEEISFFELFTFSAKAPRYLKETALLLETTVVADLIFETSDYVYLEDVEDVVDTVDGVEIVFALVIVFFGALGLFSLATLVLHLINKINAFKIVFFVLIALLVAGLCVAFPMITNAVDDMAGLPERLEDIALQITVFPFLAAVLALVPVILDIVLFAKRRKEKKLQAQQAAWQPPVQEVPQVQEQAAPQTAESVVEQ